MSSQALYGKSIGVGLVGLAGLAAQGLLTTTAQAASVTGYDLKAAKKVFESPPLGPEFKFGINIAAGDLDGDGKAEIIAGTSDGTDAASLSYIKFDGLGLVVDKTSKHSSDASAGFGGGLRVATGDLDGDGAVDMVVAPSSGEGEKMRAASGPYLKITLKEVFVTSFDHKMTGGTNATVGHFKIGLEDTLVIGSSASAVEPTGEKQASSIRRASVDIAALHQSPGNDLADYIKFRESEYIYGPQYSGGIRVASGDIDGDGIDELLTLNEQGASRSISFLKYDDSGVGKAGTGIFIKIGDIKGELEIAKGVPDTSSFSIACGDLDGDGKAEVIVGDGPGGGPNVRVFSFVDGTPPPGTAGAASGWSLLQTFTPYGSSYTGGFNLAVGNVDGLGDNELLIAPASLVPEPGVIATAIGAAGFVARRRRRDVRQE